MRTPLDGAIRLKRREIDDLKAEIGIHVDRLTIVQVAQADLRAQFANELDVAGADVLLPTDAYMARLRAERQALERSRQLLDGNLDILRGRAVEAYGGCKAMETVADTLRADEQRRIEGAEQAGLDDFATARFVAGGLAGGRKAGI